MSADDDTISYNYSQCENVYEELVRDQGTISTQISSLENTINGLMQTWKGISADQWKTIQSQWMTAIGNMSGDLNKAAAALPEMADNMKTTDKNAAARIATIGH
jgi:WXG100 family type VII secretion target